MTLFERIEKFGERIGLLDPNSCRAVARDYCAAVQESGSGGTAILALDIEDRRGGHVIFVPDLTAQDIESGVRFVTVESGLDGERGIAIYEDLGDFQRRKKAGIVTTIDIGPDQDFGRRVRARIGELRSKRI